MQHRTAWTMAAILAGLTLIGWITWPQWAPQPRGPNTGLILEERAHPNATVLPVNTTRANAPGLADALDQIVEGERSLTKIRDPDQIDAYCEYLEKQDLGCFGSYFRYRDVTFRAAITQQ